MKKIGPRTRGILVLLLALHLLFAPPLKAADSQEVGMWIGSGALSLLYTPVKAAFFLLMGITGGLSAIVTVPLDEFEISQRLIKWGFYGDWLIRPDHLRGEAFPQFVGTKDEIRFVFLAPDPKTGKFFKVHSTLLGRR